MPLERITPRRTIELSGFSFASGSIELIHPYDVPLNILVAFSTQEDSLEQYYTFNFVEGVISEDDFLFLSDLAAAEALELAEMLQAVMQDETPLTGKATPLAAKEELSDEDEALLKKFNELLGGIAEAAEEQGNDDEEGSEEPPC